MLAHYPIEHLGRARDFRRRVLAEDLQLLDLSHRIVQPLVARIKRHPERAVRASVIDGLIRDWREMPTCVFSLDFAVSRLRHGALITERRICAAEMKDDDDPDIDRVVSVSEVCVSVDRNRVRQDHLVLCFFPLHVLAARIGWGGADDAALIRDIDAAGRFDVGRIPENKAVVIEATDGAWHARAVRVETGPGVSRRLVRCHAWVPA